MERFKKSLLGDLLEKEELPIGNMEKV